MSPHYEMGEIWFKLCCLFFCLSVRHAIVSSTYLFEPQVGFTNNCLQMLSMMSRCAVRMFNQGWFKVKVIVQG